MKKLRKPLSTVLALLMLLSLSPYTFTSFAVPKADASNESGASELFEPWKHGYRYVDVLNWDPSTDPYADELRAKVPLQERNEPFTATQANPNLKSEAQLYNVAAGNYRSTDVTEAPWNGNMHYDEFSYSAYKFWQYTDMIGAGGRPTSGFDRGSAEKEYGVIGIPIAAYINSAHKNGVKAIAEYFIPRDPMFTEEFLYKDKNGEFPYAKKMVEIQRYYGFDGYFMNQEGAFDVKKVPIMKEMLAWMCEQDCYIQWYDSVISSTGKISYRNEFVDDGQYKNSDWVKDDVYGKVSDSFWINYWWNGSTQLNRIPNSVDTALRQGLDPFKTLFLGVESGMGRFVGAPAGSGNNSSRTTRYLDLILDETDNPVMSIALWGSDFTSETYLKNPPENDRYKSQYVWASEERERMWYTSPKQNPTDFSTDIDRTDVLVDPSPNADPASKTNEIYWKGISRYIAERSVINGSVFNTTFNNGRGMQHFKNGQVSRDLEWANINIQDILPTWQWWVDGDNNEKLDLDWDYGSKLQKWNMDGTVSSFDYEQIGAFDGGSSLAIYGDLEGTNFVNLYKTDLNVKANSKISLTYKKTSANDSSTMKLGVIFKDDPTEKVYFPIENAGNKTDDWKTAEFSLGSYAGKDIAALGLELASASEITDYQVNLGQLKISDGANHTPSTPKDFAIKYAFDETDEVHLSWTLDSYDTVKQYNVYASYKDGSEKIVGGIYDDNYYIQKLEDKDNITSLNLKAVGIDGSESSAASVKLNDDKAVSNIKTESKNNKLYVTWDEPNSTFDSVKVEMNYWYSDKESTSLKVNKGAKKATLNIPLEDSIKYILTVTTINADKTENKSVNYFGKLSDNFCEPYDGELRVNTTEDSNFPGTFNIPPPLSSDWDRLLITVNGTTETHRRGGVITMKQLPLPNGYAKISVIVVDRYGNRSKPVDFEYMDRVLVEKSDDQYTMDPNTGVVYRDNQLQLALKNNVILESYSSFTWELVGTYNARTSVSANGLLSVDLDESEDIITVKATKNDDATVVITGVFAIKDAETLTALNFPDPILYDWVVKNFGDGTSVTNAQIEYYKGIIDLSNLDINDFTGLNLFINTTELNLSENENITELNSNFFPPKLEKLTLEDCLNLKYIRKTAFRDLVKLYYIDITGCSQLEFLDLKGVALENLVFRSKEDFPNLEFIDLTNTSLDVTGNRNNWELVKFILDKMVGKTAIVPVYENLALNKPIIDTNFPASSLFAINDGNISKWDHSDRVNTAANPGYIVFDMGEEVEVDSLELHVSNLNYQAKDFTISSSTDGATFDEISSFVGNPKANFSSTLPPIKGRYFKINITANYSASRAVQIAEILIYGNRFVETADVVRFNGEEPDFTNLNALIDEIEGLNSNNYLPKTWSLIEAALSDTKLIAEDIYSIQSELDFALDQLLEAKGALIAKPDKSKLIELIEYAENLDWDLYNDTSLDILNSALTKAIIVSDDDNATAEDVNVAVTALSDAIATLVKIEQPTTSGSGGTSTTGSTTTASSKPTPPKTGEKRNIVMILSAILFGAVFTIATKKRKIR